MTFILYQWWSMCRLPGIDNIIVRFKLFQDFIWLSIRPMYNRTFVKCVSFRSNVAGKKRLGHKMPPFQSSQRSSSRCTKGHSSFWRKMTNLFNNLSEGFPSEIICISYLIIPVDRSQWTRALFSQSLTERDPSFPAVTDRSLKWLRNVVLGHWKIVNLTNVSTSMIFPFSKFLISYITMEKMSLLAADSSTSVMHM